MKVAPTLNGGMRIDAEEAEDWEILRYLPYDARPQELARHLGKMAGPEAEDWDELVVPELHERFNRQLAYVYQAIEDASNAAHQGPGALFITKENAELWYGALNQARLSLHARFELPESVEELIDAPPERRGAFHRSHFYQILQSILLDHVL